MSSAQARGRAATIKTRPDLRPAGGWWANSTAGTRQAQPRGVTALSQVRKGKKHTVLIIILTVLRRTDREKQPDTRQVLIVRNRIKKATN